MTLFLIALFTGCTGMLSTDPSDTGLPDNGPAGSARVKDICGPADGAALEFAFGLAEDGCDAPLSDDGWLRIMIWDKSWGGLDAEKHAIDWIVYSADGVDEVDGSEGWVEIEDLAGDSVSGSYEVKTDSGEWIKGTFESLTFCEQDEMCG